MLKKLTPEQFWQLYQKLPLELKDALFAEETGNNIEEVCLRNEIEDNLGEMVDLVGQVLIGVLPPDGFQSVLGKELGLEKEAAKKVAQEINRFIFYPVKPVLEQLYKIEAASTEKTAKKVEKKPEIEEPSSAKDMESEKNSSALVSKDTYREPIE